MCAGASKKMTLEGDDENWARAVVPPGVRAGEGLAGWPRGTFLADQQMRRAGGRLVEHGELPLYLDPDSDGADELPLCLVDYAMVERKGAGRSVSVEPGAWNDACRLVGMHAVVFGVGEGVDAVELERQCAAWMRRGMGSVRP